jgi:hypothetical protein
MAKVLRKDTEELVGHLDDLRGSVQSWTKDWPFRAWRHPDGKLRNYPGVPPPNQPMSASTPIEVRLAVRNSPAGEMEVLLRVSGFHEEPHRAPGLGTKTKAPASDAQGCGRNVRT